MTLAQVRPTTSHSTPKDGLFSPKYDVSPRGGRPTSLPSQPPCRPCGRGPASTLHTSSAAAGSSPGPAGGLDSADEICSCESLTNRYENHQPSATRRTHPSALFRPSEQILKLPNTNPPSLGCPESLTCHPFETSIHCLTFASSCGLAKS